MTIATRLLLPLLLLISTLASAAPAGNVAESEGTVFVTAADGRKRLVSVGSTLEKGDTIQTGRQSSAKIRYADGSEMYVRPSSTLVIQDFSFEEKQPDKDSFVVGLVRGGLRQITGAIGKRGNQDAYRLNSPTSTMGIRGTDFTARLCQGNDCSEGAKSTRVPSSGRTVVAKVVDFKGKVSALQASGLRRDLSEDGSVYQDDLIEVQGQGHAALLFIDETRIVVPGNSSFRVSNYHYNKEKPQQSKAGFDLVRGSLRMATGLIGKGAPANVSVSTGTATIGIRGTSFDLACVSGGIADPESFVGNSGEGEGGGGGGGGSNCDEGLYTLTREGAISVTNRNGQSMTFAAGQASYVGGPNQMPIQLRLAPSFLNQLPGPPPEKIRLDIPDVFGIDGSTQGEVGLYVTVTEGKVVIMQANRELLLNKGETGFASGTAAQLQRLIVPPPFLSQDQRQSQQSMGFRGCRI